MFLTKTAERPCHPSQLVFKQCPRPQQLFMSATSAHHGILAYGEPGWLSTCRVRACMCVRARTRAGTRHVSVYRRAMLHTHPCCKRWPYCSGHITWVAILDRWPYCMGGIAHVPLHRWPYCTGGDIVQEGHVAQAGPCCACPLAGPHLVAVLFFCTWL